MKLRLPATNLKTSIKMSASKARQKINQHSTSFVDGLHRSIGSRQQLKKRIRLAYFKSEKATTRAKEKIEKMMLSSDFENMLDLLIKFKRQTPEEGKVTDGSHESRYRIKRKLVQILSLYKREIELGLGQLMLPAKFAKYFFYLLIAFEIFDLSKTKAKEPS